jgi:hypothetical protein
MGRECSTYGGEREFIEDIGGKAGRKGTTGKIILKTVLTKIGWGDMAQDRDQWRALVNTVINLPIP